MEFVHVSSDSKCGKTRNWMLIGHENGWMFDWLFGRGQSLASAGLHKSYNNELRPVSSRTFEHNGQPTILSRECRVTDMF